MSISIKPREKDAILQSLRAGVVPRIGLQHIQVGRKEEVAAILQDLQRIENGGATVRFIIGRFGSGKSFFLNLARMVALEKRFVVAQADITPNRRLHATGGQARGLFSELMQNIAVRSKPEGGALASIVEKWVTDLDYKERSAGVTNEMIIKKVYEQLKPLQDLVSGYDFATVIVKYFEGFQDQNDALISAALRWLRAEYSTKTEARQDLGVRSIIDDRDIYEYLKLFAAFVRMAGYAGLIVNIDEMGVLSHRLNNAQARNANYEMILRIVNDCLQGNVSSIGVIFAGTDSFFDDRRRGLASYEALASRLSNNMFAVDGLRDLSGPVIQLINLSPEDLYVLLYNIRNVFASGNSDKYLIPDDALTAFLNHCSRILGSEFYRTPRDSVRAFVGLLSVLEQNPQANWQNLLSSIKINTSKDPESEGVHEDCPNSPGETPNDELATFRL